MSFPEIGRLLGDRDHTTILHGVRKIERLIQFDDRLSDDVAAIRDLAIAADPELGALA
jgi:chromosomal replication initiator protein